MIAHNIIPAVAASLLSLAVLVAGWTQLDTSPPFFQTGITDRPIHITARPIHITGPEMTSAA